MLQMDWNGNWRFWNAGHPADACPVQLPHDAMRMEARDASLPEGHTTAWYPGGKYVYEKHFSGDGLVDKNVLMEIEGAYRHAEITLNDLPVGIWKYGYTGFFVPLTHKIRTGENVLRVVVDNSQTPNSRWYSGSGLYRPVSLWVAQDAYFVPDGLRVTTLSTHPARVQVDVQAVCRLEDSIKIAILHQGKNVAQAEGNLAVLEIPEARLWCAEQPALYEICLSLHRNGQLLDEHRESFGIRQLAWDAKSGFQVNGKTVKFRGGCMHHDNGLLGAAAYTDAEWRKARIIKKQGFNAVRCAHNPPSKAFLSACDGLGLYVMEEAFDQWQVPQTAYDYAANFDAWWEQDITAMVRRDYNHPSIVMYSVGNEISDLSLPKGAAICKALSEKIHGLDSSRPVTLAVNSLLTGMAYEQARHSDDVMGSMEINNFVTLMSKVKSSMTAGHLAAILGKAIEHVDILGLNYSEALFEGMHALFPDVVIVSSETYPSRLAENWPLVLSLPYVVGDFQWTAWDYLGETGLGLPEYGTAHAPFTKPYPCLAAACGSMDITGQPTPQMAYTQIAWGLRSDPYIAVRPVNHTDEAYSLGLWRLTDASPRWAWPGLEGCPAEILIFSNASVVALWQENKLISKEKPVACACTFRTTYHPGMLTAVAYNAAGQETGRAALCTPGDAAALILTAEQPAIRPGQLIFLNLALADPMGREAPQAEYTISLQTDGPVTLLAAGNADPEQVDPFSPPPCKTWQGRAQIVLRGEAAGIGTLSVHASGLQPASICISITE